MRRPVVSHRPGWRIARWKGFSFDFIKRLLVLMTGGFSSFGRDSLSHVIVPDSVPARTNPVRIFYSFR